MKDGDGVRKRLKRWQSNRGVWVCKRDVFGWQSMNPKYNHFAMPLPCVKTKTDSLGYAYSRAPQGHSPTPSALIPPDTQNQITLGPQIKPIFSFFFQDFSTNLSRYWYRNYVLTILSNWYWYRVSESGIRFCLYYFKKIHRYSSSVLDITFLKSFYIP